MRVHIRIYLQGKEMVNSIQNEIFTLCCNNFFIITNYLILHELFVWLFTLKFFKYVNNTPIMTQMICTSFYYLYMFHIAFTDETLSFNFESDIIVFRFP